MKTKTLKEYEEELKKEIDEQKKMKFPMLIRVENYSYKGDTIYGFAQSKGMYWLEDCDSYELKHLKEKGCKVKKVSIKQIQLQAELKGFQKSQEMMREMIETLISKNRNKRSWDKLTERERGIENGLEQLLSELKKEKEIKNEN